MRQIATCQEYFETLEDRFLAENAKGVTATYQYELSGDTGGTWTVSVVDGVLSVTEGPSSSPNVTYKMKAENYVKLANGKLNGTKAVLTRKLKVSGNILLAKKMNDFLPPAKG